MHPRYLYGPTALIAGLILVMAIGLWAMGPKQNDPNEVTLERVVPFQTDKATARQAFMARYREELLPQVIGGCVVMALVFALPIKRGPMFIVVKPALFMVGAFVTHLIRQSRTDSEGAMFQIIIIGGIVIAIFAVISYFRKAFPETKYPAHFRWSNPDGQQPVDPDDPAALERLEHFRAVVAANKANNAS